MSNLKLSNSSYPQSEDLNWRENNVKYQSKKNTYTTGQTVKIELLLGQYKNNPALLFTKDSYVSGTVEFTTTNDNLKYRRGIEKNVNSLFKNIKVLYDGVVINEVKNVAQYKHMIDDLTMTSSSKMSHSISKMGAQPVKDRTIPTLTSTISTYVGTQNLEAVWTNAEILYNYSMTDSKLGYSPINTAEWCDFSFKLPNLLGTELNKPLPLHMLDNGRLIIEIELNAVDDICLSNATASDITELTLYNVCYNAKINNIPRDIADVLYPPNEPFMLYGSLYEFEKLPANVGDQYISNYFHNFKYKWAKNLLFYFENEASKGDQQKSYLSQRIKANTSQYQLYYKNKNYNRVNNVAEMWNEIECAFDMKNNSSITYDQYDTNANDDTTASDTILNADPTTSDYLPQTEGNVKSFVGCLNLQKYKSSEYFTGTKDISDEDIRLDLWLEQIDSPILKTAFNLTNQLNLCAYLRYDCVYIITPEGKLTIDR